MRGLTSRLSQRPHYRISSACLPQHPAVVYLFLVRSMLRIPIFVLAVALAGCATQDSDWYLSQKEALAIAKNALTASNFQTSRYPSQRLWRFTDTRDWYIEFSPAPPGPGGNDVLVVLNDESRKTTVRVLPVRWSSRSPVVVPHYGELRSWPPNGLAR
jgi:hypothetical protein